MTMLLAPIQIPKLAFRSPEKIRNTALMKKFPVKFWRLVNSCQTNAVCWGFGGNSVRILKEKFEEQYLHGENRPFKTVTFSSFVRQLNLYGFRKVIRPVITNEHGQKLNTSLIEYRHPMFLQGHPELLARIKRNTKSPIDEARKLERVKFLPLNNLALKRKLDTVESDTENDAETSQTEPVKKDRRSEIRPSLCDVTNLIRRTTESKRNGSTLLRDELTSTSAGQCAATKSLQQPSGPLSVADARKLGLIPSSLISSSITGQLTSGKGPIFTQSRILNKPSQSGCQETGTDSSTQTTTGDKTDKCSNQTTSTNSGLCQIKPGLAPRVITVKKECVPVSENGHQLKQNQTIGQSIHVPPVTQAVRGFMMPSGVKGQSVLYLNPPPGFSRQAIHPAANPTRCRPLKIHPQPVVVYNIPRPVSATSVTSVESLALSATCEQVASHPLLQPVRREFLQQLPRKHGGSVTNTNIHFMMRPRLTSTPSLPNIPECDPLSESAVSPCHQSLADLSLFKLSSSLKDIDDPENSDIDVSTIDTGNESENFIKEKTPVLTDSERSCESPGGNRRKSSPTLEYCVDVEMKELASASPGTVDRLQDDSDRQTDISKLAGPRRELFKEKVTNRITIPLSGLPQDLFSLDTTGLPTHHKEAVVTIETSEDGKVTGHLILPRKNSVPQAKSD